MLSLNYEYSWKSHSWRKFQLEDLHKIKALSGTKETQETLPDASLCPVTVAVNTGSIPLSHILKIGIWAGDTAQWKGACVASIYNYHVQSSGPQNKENENMNYEIMFLILCQFSLWGRATDIHVSENLARWDDSCLYGDEKYCLAIFGRNLWYLKGWNSNRCGVLLMTKLPNLRPLLTSICHLTLDFTY